MSDDDIHELLITLPRRILIFLALCLLLLLVAAGGANQDDSLTGTQRMAVELLRLRTILANDLPSLESLDDFGKAVALRDHIHQNVTVGDAVADWSQPSQVYLDSTRGDLGHRCGGFTLLYLAALESQGIPTRYVGLFDGESSHATAEFWAGGQWYASDPTLNAMYADRDGRYLSYAELYDLVQSGEAYEIVNNGYEVRPEVAQLASTPGLLNTFVVIHPAKVWQAGEYYGYELTLLPREWDGTIGGRNVAVYKSPYTDLAALR